MSEDWTTGDDAHLYSGLNEVYAIGKFFCGMPLYGWYVFTIQQFNAGDIQGMLSTPPIEIDGPFETQDLALASIKEFLEDDIE